MKDSNYEQEDGSECGSGNVRRLRERFEKRFGAVTSSHSSSSATRNINKCQAISRHRGTKQTSAGIYQKRSILRRKSKSHSDVRTNGRSSVMAAGRYNTMSKSCSQGEQLSERPDLLTAIRRDALKKSVMERSVGSTVEDTATLLSSSYIDHSDDDGVHDESRFIQSMYAGGSVSQTTEQGRERRHRPKPTPPAKSAMLRNSNCCRSTQKSFPPAVPPKPSISLLSRSRAGTVDSTESTKLHTAEVIFIMENNTTSNVAETTRELEEHIKKLKSEPSTSELSRCSPSKSNRTASTARRASFINEEIKKPKVKPPPPPTQSSSLSPSFNSGKECNKLKSVKKKLHAGIAASADITAVTVADRQVSSSKPHRFERKCIGGKQIPSLPSIPPPLPPVLPVQDSTNDEMYEEIEQLTYSEETGEFAEKRTVDEHTDDVLILKSNFDESGQSECYAAGEDGKLSNLSNDNGHSINDQFAVTTLRGSPNEQHYLQNSGTNHTVMNMNRKPLVKRPKSALEFDKLLRITDIRLNITKTVMELLDVQSERFKKKVDQIKLKVSSVSQEKQRRKRLSMFYVGSEAPKNCSDDEVQAKNEFPLDEQCIYGDNWSSDEDDITTTTTTTASTEQYFVNSDEIVKSKSEPCSDGNVAPNEHGSMLSEIEKELRLRFRTNSNILDNVLQSKRRSISADPLPQDTTANSEETADHDTRGRHSANSIYGVYGQTKGLKLRPTKEGYETVTSPTSTSPERNCPPSTSSEYTLKEIDRSVYTPRIIPDPQPLYQIYMMEQNERLIYEDEEQEANQPSSAENTGINSKMVRAPSTASTDSGRGADCSTTVSQLTSNTSMRRDRLVAGSHFGSQRSLWCELPEVINSNQSLTAWDLVAPVLSKWVKNKPKMSVRIDVRSAGLLETLDEETKKLQEAYFEVITSEASYLLSLNILITHFMAAPEMLGSKGPSSVITNEERKQLFSNIFAVRDCSERLLSDLENRLQSNLVLSDVCDILCDHFETNFDSYVKYCSNQVYQDRTLRKLKSENASFLACVQRLESDRLCQGLDMRSFLMLPMQRVTRYPLLVIAILERTQQDTTNYQTAQIALHLANHIVTCCNEGARHMERTEQLLEIESRLIYKSSDLRRIPLVSSGRYLVKRGPLTWLNERRSKRLLQTKQQFQTIYVFLFSDLIMLTKEKVNGTYVCKDYSARRFVDIEPVEIDDPKLMQSVIAHIPVKKPHLFICTLMHNARGKQVELLLNADSESDRERWLSALRPPACSNPEEKIYADWDCPQAVAVHQYAPGQEDELALEKGDLINILRKMPDGWFYGERVRDGFSGWFPSSYVQQVLNDHVRAKNYRQRLRVMQAAAAEQMKTVADEGTRHTPHLMDRFRRLSNSKNI